jgi:LacI family transcriptional regulator
MANAPRRAKLLDVAAAAGVSKALASRALGGYSDVAPATRERILAVARRLGYRASARGRALAAGKDALPRAAVVALGIEAPRLAADLYLGQVLSGIVASPAAEQLDVHVTAIRAQERWTAGGQEASAAKAEALARLVAEDRADGIILLTYQPLAPEDIAPLEDARVPVVLVNRHVGMRPVHAVTVDYARAMAHAVTYLTNLGHRRLALLLPRRDTTVVRDRAHGWRRARRRLGIDPQAGAIVWYADADPEAERNAVRRLLDQGLPQSGERPTALACYSDLTARVALAEAAARGMQVPQQLSVLGCVETLAPHLLPPLSGYGPPPSEIGAAAAAHLVAVLNGEEPTPRRVILPSPFTDRGSCATPSAPAGPTAARAAATPPRLSAGWSGAASPGRAPGRR